MTIAVNIEIGRNEVALMCTKLDVRFAAIETLPSGATRVFLATAEDARAIRQAFETLVLSNPVKVDFT